MIPPGPKPDTDHLAVKSPKTRRADLFKRAFDRRVQRRAWDRAAREALSVHNGSGFSRADFWSET